MRVRTTGRKKSGPGRPVREGPPLRWLFSALALAGSVGSPLARGAAATQEVSPPELTHLSIPADEHSQTLVREVRNLRLVQGRNFVRVYDFSPRLEPSSVFLRSLTSPSHLELLQQSFWFEVLDRKRLLELLVGQEITLHREFESGSEDFGGRLLLAPSAPGPNGELPVPAYVETPEGKVRPIGDAELRLENLPEGGWNRPRLDWVLEAQNAGRDRVEMSYRTEGLSHEVHYLVRISDDGARADLRCGATIHNRTGVSFPEAQVQLLAPTGVVRASQEAVGDRAAAHLYPLPEPITIEARRDLQVQLAAASDLPVSTYAALWAADRPLAGGVLPVWRAFDLENRVEGGLGRPLPPGDLEVRRLDDQGRMYASPPVELAASVAGDTWTVPTEALAGVYATVARQPAANGSLVTLRFVNERPASVRVTVLEPLAVRERVVTDSSRLDLTRVGWARIQVEVPSASSLALQYTVGRDG